MAERGRRRAVTAALVTGSADVKGPPDGRRGPREVSLPCASSRMTIEIHSHVTAAQERQALEMLEAALVG
jgi:hypothetical protein